MALLIVAMICVAGLASRRLDAHVKNSLLADRPFATASFVDLPEPLVLLAQGDLEDSVQSLLDGPWTEDRICRSLVKRLETVGWVRQVNYVRRTSDARFSISCSYRIPAAMVAHGTQMFMVDAEGVRLPGTYRGDPSWRVIEGVAGAPVQPGVSWPGGDLQAGLQLLKITEGQPFADQIRAVVVENFGGRRNLRQSHLEMITDVPGGRIRWGSTPGRELEENSVNQKLAILRENHRRTGRADAGHTHIDVSTFPDRFTIPG